VLIYSEYNQILTTDWLQTETHLQFIFWSNGVGTQSGRLSDNLKTHGHHHSDRMYSLIQSNIYIYDLPALSRVFSLFWEVLHHVREIPRGLPVFAWLTRDQKGLKLHWRQDEQSGCDNSHSVYVFSLFSPKLTKARWKCKVKCNLPYLETESYERFTEISYVYGKYSRLPKRNIFHNTAQKNSQNSDVSSTRLPRVVQYV